tara:strand:- start:18 stop:404 length:387 start_codon:yes stop_codon:yes gene_type:complete
MKKPQNNTSNVCGIRGATTAKGNSTSSIIDATIELLEKLTSENDVSVDTIAAVFFTTTNDLNAEFPAAAARKLGWLHIPLLGSLEIDVPNAPKYCIRVMMLINTQKTNDEIRHIYLHGAEDLRNRKTT